MAVLRALVELYHQASPGLRRYLREKVDCQSRGKLLFLAAVLHDIAKPEVIARTGQGTACPDHEARGAKKVAPILKRFQDLSGRERGMIRLMIKSHDVIH